MMPGLKVDSLSMSKARRKTSPPGFVRIIGGTWRRQRIAIPTGVDLRPTPDRVRETLFNWLSPMLPGAICLDLFAGSGVLGFEALSRGAAEVVMVERHSAAVEALERVRHELDAAATIVCTDAETYLKQPDTGRFDIVFVDPPYSDPVDSLLASLLPVIKPTTAVYLERAHGDAWPALAEFEWRRSTAGGVDFGLAELRA
jgi:16S rRNA (guanine966-N2)-methyltransferase